MTIHKVLGGTAWNPSPNRFLEHFSQPANKSDATGLRHGRFKYRHLFYGNAMAPSDRSVELFCQRFADCIVLVRTLHQRTNYRLPCMDAAKKISPFFRCFEVVKNVRMAGVSDKICNVISYRQISCQRGSRVQGDKYRSRASLRYDRASDIAEQSVWQCEDNHVCIQERLRFGGCRKSSFSNPLTTDFANFYKQKLVVFLAFK